MKNFRVYLKFLSRNKLYTFVSVFGFSISLMFVIILSFYVKQEFTKDNFHENSDRIYIAAYDDDDKLAFAVPFAQYVKDNCPEVEAVSKTKIHFPILDNNSQKESLKAIVADENFFSLFSFKLIEGDAATSLNKPNSVVITKNLAKRLFKSESPIGKSLNLDSKTYTITGVINNMQNYNTILPNVDVIMDMNSLLRHSDLQNWNTAGTVMFFLEKKGNNIEDKTDFLRSYLSTKAAWYKDFHLVPLSDAYFSVSEINPLMLKNNSRVTVLVYFSIGILILMISILNYINMTVAQCASRGKEVAIKKLIGGSRKSIIIQFLSESLIITIITFILGLIMAVISQPYFDNILGSKLVVSSKLFESSANLNLLAQFTPSVIALVIVAILIISFIIGIVPAMIISGFRPLEVVKGAFSKKVKTSFSKVLIIFQYTIAIGLLICSFCINKQASYMLNHDTGFNKDRILVMDNVLDKTQTEGFKAKLLSLSEVENVSYSVGTPINGGWNNNPEINGEQTSFQMFMVDTAFFKVYGIEVKPTGIIANKETRLVNDYTYKFLQPDPVTQEVDFGKYQGKFQISGVSNNFNISSLHQPLNLVCMLMLEDRNGSSISVKISDGADLLAATNLIEKTYSDYNGGKFFNSEFVDVSMQKWYVNEKQMSSIMSVFTLLTLIIMMMGVFAMSLYMVRQKEKEIGVRKVNGATVEEILAMLNKESLIKVLIGFVIATPLSYYAINKWLHGFAYKTSISWWIFLLAAIIVALLTLVSVSWMTYRAATANPVESLKSE